MGRSKRLPDFRFRPQQESQGILRLQIALGNGGTRIALRSALGERQEFAQLFSSKPRVPAADLVLAEASVEPDQEAGAVADPACALAAQGLRHPSCNDKRGRGV